MDVWEDDLLKNYLWFIDELFFGWFLVLNYFDFGWYILDKIKE